MEKYVVRSFCGDRYGFSVISDEPRDWDGVDNAYFTVKFTGPGLESPHTFWKFGCSYVANGPHHGYWCGFEEVFQILRALELAYRAGLMYRTMVSITHPNDFMIKTLGMKLPAIGNLAGALTRACRAGIKAAGGPKSVPLAVLINQ